MPLTDIECRTAKPTESVRKLSDGQGLQLWIMPNGSKLWRQDYRFAGKRKLLAIGPYPAITLVAARKARGEARALVAGGIDPSDAKQEAKAARIAQEAAADSFKAVAEGYVAKLKREGRAPATMKKIEWLLDFALPDLGKLKIGEISSAKVLAVLRKVEAREAYESAHRLRSTIGAVFRYGIASALCENDPTQALKGALTTPTVTPRAALLKPTAFGALLRSIEDFDGQPTTQAALRLMAYLFPRPGELRMAEWAEFDLAAAAWEIPTSRMKMRRPHRIPLSQQAVAILKDLQALSGKGRLVLPCVRTFARPISENTLNAALRRLGYAKEEATAHGFRATASTLLNESGKWRPDVIEAALAHIGADEIRRAYLRSDFWEERKAMMQWWADYIDRLREGGKVLAIVRGS
ncbi:integrase arm-type DNA-binding domain-containing protein [Labrys sp. LIt4]|uniref:tyrosine-type recombinase/integrase n=1 Tax=Labrys sp. LIt4 TaxID=2821355 RepID=UPI001AE0AD91|nr:integrase arm-type DNA-binding domain-containing protein [Labrys sp. LIt4]MBP0579594.1 integrase arm-type DNA-binding domain-containing protein [Labrys sp. LIt4]